ncbi:MAG: hypothetical protein HQ592_15980 [Planctomycetes bacterium]|nr:hypothetical protein [Planctomycetota bacterium]
MKRRKRNIIITIAVGAVVFAAVVAYLEREDTTGIDTPAWWLERAVRELESSPEDGYYYIQVLRVYARAGDIKQAFAAVEKMTSAAQPSLVRQALNSVRSLLRDIGIGSLRITSRIIPSKPDCLSAIAIVQAEQGDIEGAKTTAEHLGTGQGDQDWAEGVLAQTYAAIAKAQARKGDFDGAMETAKRLRDDYSPPPTNARSELIATLHAMEGDAAAAQVTISAIELPSQWMLRDIAVILAKRGDEENYQTFIRLAEQAVVRIPQAKQENVLMIRSSGQAGAGDLSGASATIEKIVDANSRLALCTDRGWRCERMRNRKLSDMYYRLAADAAETAERTSEALSNLAHAYAGLGDTEAALAAAKEITEGSDLSNANCHIAIAFAQKGDFDRAKAYAKSVEHPPWTWWGRREIARQLAMAGQRLELLKWIKSLPTPYDRACAYVNAAEGIIEKNNEAKTSDGTAKEQETE